MNTPAPASPLQPAASSGGIAPPSGLLAMLHESRRRDAARVISRHRHLLTGRAEGQLSGPVFAIECSARVRPAADPEAALARRKLVGKCLIAVLVLAIGVAHLMGATVLMRAAASQQSKAVVSAFQGD